VAYFHLAQLVHAGLVIQHVSRARSRWTAGDLTHTARNCCAHHIGDAAGGHCHGNCIGHALRTKAFHESCRCDRISPLCSLFGSEDPQRRSGDEMALNIEGIVNCTVYAEKPLGRSS